MYAPTFSKDNQLKKKKIFVFFIYLKLTLKDKKVEKSFLKVDAQNGLERERQSH